MVSFVTVVQEPVTRQVWWSAVLRSFVTLNCHLLYTLKIIIGLHRQYTHNKSLVAFNCGFVLIEGRFCVLL